MARHKNEAINSYITDMLALEDHIEKAIRGQLEDLEDYPEVVRELKQIHHKVEHHISDLRNLSERRAAGGPANIIKRAGSAALGLGPRLSTWYAARGCRKICGMATRPSVWRQSDTRCSTPPDWDSMIGK